MNTIPFNKPYFTGRELAYIEAAVKSGKIGGDGPFTKKCHRFFEERFAFKKVLLTTSCTDALEMAALLTDIRPDDEVIVPSYTFVSSTNAFVLRGAKIIFADSYTDNPNIDAGGIESLITARTKAIVPVHYAGVACDMDHINALAGKHDIFVVEDAAQATDSYYTGKPLGSQGQLSAFSFHESKNITSGEGGMLVINDERFIERAEIIREKGTNRNKFLKGEVDKYSWVDIGSSFLPSDMLAAFLFAQLESLDAIQTRRKAIWNRYYHAFENLSVQKRISLPAMPAYATNNAHIFYLVTKHKEERTELISALATKGITAVFHNLALHKSPYFADKHDGRTLPNADRFTDCLVRLPLYCDLTDEEQERVIEGVLDFYK